MLVKDESDYADWQKEAKINEENTAERAYDENMRLLKDGEEITLKKWAADIINEMYGMCDVFGIDERPTLNLMCNRIKDPSLTYGKRLLKLIEKEGYINTHMMLSKNNKQTSIDAIKKMDLYPRKDLQKYVNIALVGK